MKRYDIIKSHGLSELIEIEKMLCDYQTFSMLTYDEKIGLMQDYLFLQGKQSALFIPGEMGMRLYMEVAYNPWLDRLLNALVKNVEDGEYCLAEMKSGLLKELSYGRILTGRVSQGAIREAIQYEKDIKAGKIKEIRRKRKEEHRIRTEETIRRVKEQKGQEREQRGREENRRIRKEEEDTQNRKAHEEQQVLKTIQAEQVQKRIQEEKKQVQEEEEKEKKEKKKVQEEERIWREKEQIQVEKEIRKKEEEIRRREELDGASKEQEKEQKGSEEKTDSKESDSEKEEHEIDSFQETEVTFIADPDLREVWRLEAATPEGMRRLYLSFRQDKNEEGIRFLKTMIADLSDKEKEEFYRDFFRMKLKGAVEASKKKDEARSILETDPYFQSLGMNKDKLLIPLLRGMAMEGEPGAASNLMEMFPEEFLTGEKGERARKIENSVLDELSNEEKESVREVNQLQNIEIEIEREPDGAWNCRVNPEQAWRIAAKDLDMLNRALTGIRTYGGTLTFLTEDMQTLNRMEAYKNLQEALGKADKLGKDSTPAEVREVFRDIKEKLWHYLAVVEGMEGSRIEKVKKYALNLMEYIPMVEYRMKMAELYPNRTYGSILSEAYRGMQKVGRKDLAGASPEQLEADRKEKISSHARHSSLLLSEQVRQAKKYLKELNRLKIESKDSAQFTKLRLAMEKVAGLTQENTPAEIQEAFGSLMSASTVYVEKIKVMGGGAFLFGGKSGGRRYSLAKKINGFAEETMMNVAIDKMLDVTKPLKEQVSDTMVFRLGSGENLKSKEQNGFEVVDRLEPANAEIRPIRLNELESKKEENVRGKTGNGLENGRGKTGNGLENGRGKTGNGPENGRGKNGNSLENKDVNLEYSKRN